MEDFVPFLLAKKLKEKGFRERTLSMYLESVKLPHTPLIYSLKDWNKEDNCYSAPTISQVLKWLREEKKLHISIECGYAEIPIWDFEIRLIGNYGRWWTDETYSSYELAAIAGVEYVIDNLI